MKCRSCLRGVDPKTALRIAGRGRSFCRLGVGLRFLDRRSFGIPFTHAPNGSARKAPILPPSARASAAARSSRRLSAASAALSASLAQARSRRAQRIHLGEHRVHRLARRRAGLQARLRAGRRVELCGIDVCRPAGQLERGGVLTASAVSSPAPCLHQLPHCEPDDLVGRAVVEAAAGGQHVGDVGGVREALARDPRHALCVDAHAREHRGREPGDGARLLERARARGR